MTKFEELQEIAADRGKVDTWLREYIQALYGEDLSTEEFLDAESDKKFLHEVLVDDRPLSLYKEGESFDEAIKRYIYAIWKEES